jgi:hypothetical protein
MLNLLPKDRVFVDLFEQLSMTVHEGAKIMLEIARQIPNVALLSAKMKDIEHQGDKLTHDTIERVNRTFLTPFEREDIHELVCRMDDILDLMDGATRRIVLYKIERPSPDAIALADVLVRATGIIVEAMRQLRVSRERGSLLKYCIDIHTCEN